MRCLRITSKCVNLYSGLAVADRAPQNLQSTNWQTMRFKPPPPGSNIGWRVEFRSMEVQLTDFENAAYSIFIVLLSRAMLSFGLDFYIPISKVDENMKRAHKRNAAREEKFFFKKKVFQRRSALFHPNGVSNLNGAANGRPSHSRSPSSAANGVLRSLSPTNDGSRASSRASSRCASPEGLPEIDDEYEEMTINEIINGKPASGFPGLLGLVYSYLNSLNVDVSTRKELGKYLDLVKQRADGTLKTTASWMREFVRSHPEYKHDSVVSQGINFDLIHAIDDIEKGKLKVPELLGERKNWVIEVSADFARRRELHRVRLARHRFERVRPADCQEEGREYIDRSAA